MATVASTRCEEGMHHYIVRLVKGPPFKGNEEMQYEGVRLKTFNNWPNWAAVWPTLLAKAGFYYTKTADQVACFCCSGRLKTWEAGDSPMTEHKRFFPQCRFVTGRDTRNVPLGEAAVVPSGGHGSHTCNPHAPSNYYSSLASYAGSNAARHDRPSSSFALAARVQQQLPQRGQPESLPTLSSVPDGPVRRHMLAGGTPLLTDRSFSMEQLQDMKLESKRLESFTDWPTIAHIRPENLAKAGLYYLGIADRVKCAFCNGILRNWELGDEPMVEHRKFFPNCAFLRDARAAGNVTVEEEQVNIQQASQNVVANPTPSSELGVVTERPIHQNYAIEADRLSTFRQWPRDSNQSPEALAGAGFFYTGFGDNVKCFFCDGGLRNFELGDDPWTEHARWFPRCNYVKTVKGQEFISKTQTAYTGQGVTVATSNNAARLPHAGSTAAGSFPVEQRAVRARMDTSAVQMVLQMGYTRDLLHRVIENRLATVGDDFPNVQSLMEAVLAAEEAAPSSSSSQPQQSNSAASSASEPAAEAAAAEPSNTAESQASATATSTETSAGRGKNQRKKKKNKSSGAATSGKAPETSTPPSEPETKPGETDDQRLQCKICMDDEAKILFLPCGHLCCCSKCAPALRNCPICRALIRGTVRVYLP